MKDILFPASTELMECLDMAGYMLAEMRVRKDILEDSRYDYIFTVEDVNRLVLEGMPFRDAYRQIRIQVQEGEYKSTRELHHTHLGSIGNLANDKIQTKMQTLISKLN